jgi:hypothetical protein
MSDVSAITARIRDGGGRNGLDIDSFQPLASERVGVFDDHILQNLCFGSAKRAFRGQD